MKLTIFTPTSKVHSQRNVMHDTDERLANYSKRGILLNVVIFSLCLFVGEFYQRNPTFAFVLSVGLLCTTLFRGYFVFRFDELYPQAPAHWRNMFFLSALTGAVWWGFIIASVTYVNGGLYDEAPILWLYTAAFFAGSIYIFAPFERFLIIYMFAAFIPCSVVAIYIFEPMSVLYGLIMITLYGLLCRQGGIIGKNYWDKLQATYQLMRRASALEAEKITSESSLSSRDTLFSNVTHEIKSSMQEILGSLQLLKYSQLQNEEEQLVILSEQKTQQQINLLKNVSELSSVSAHDLMLDLEVIDPRSHIEQALSNSSVMAHKRNIELYSSFAGDFPLRVRGDTDRMEQLIGNLIDSACEFCEGGALLVSSSFRFEDELGQLKITVLNHDPIRTPEAMESVADAFLPHRAKNIHLGLSLSIVKGLAQCMGGNAGVDYREDGSLVFWISIRLEAIKANNNTTTGLLKLSGKKVMLYQPPQVVANVFKATLESWGLLVDIFYDETEAYEELENNIASQSYQLVIICTRLTDTSSLQLSRRVSEHEHLWAIPQIVTLSSLQRKDPEIEEQLSRYENVEVLYKPIFHRRLQKMIKGFVVEPKQNEMTAEEKDFLEGKNVLLFQKEDIDLAIVKTMLKKLGCNVTTALSIEDSLQCLSERPFHAFISESHLDGIDLKAFVEESRKTNDATQKDSYRIPILGYTSRELDGEETLCLASGMEYYIDSPTNVDDLKAILRRFVGRAEHMSQKIIE